VLHGDLDALHQLSLHRPDGMGAELGPVLETIEALRADQVKVCGAE
jgi:hypothetical protein